MDATGQFLRSRHLLQACLRSQPASSRARTSLCPCPRQRPSSSIHRHLFSSTANRKASGSSSSPNPPKIPQSHSPAPQISKQMSSPSLSGLMSLSNSIASDQQAKRQQSQQGQANQKENEKTPITRLPAKGGDADISTFATQPHHLHIYATKHNTHICFTRPNRNPIISVSCGNLGFKKGNRGTYDAAYQLGAYVFGRIQEEGWLTKIGKMELIMRGFGPGRDAVQKVLLGVEGQVLRPRIMRVVDATRLKFGGTRSKKPRRLG